MSNEPQDNWPEQYALCLVPKSLLPFLRDENGQPLHQVLHPVELVHDPTTKRDHQIAEIVYRQPTDADGCHVSIVYSPELGKFVSRCTGVCLHHEELSCKQDQTTTSSFLCKCQP